jgi:uncharacterized membrane protein YgcG
VTTTFRSLFALLAVLFTAGAIAQDLQPVPALHARVTDETATLTAPQRTSLEAKLAAIEQRKGAQVAVLMVSTTQPETIEQYATRVFDAWKLGRKDVDDGVLVIVAKNDRHVRIEVAYGLEGAIPDAAAKRVAHEYMSPRFAAGDFSGGIDAGVDALTALIDDEPLPAPSARASHGPMDLPWWHPLWFAVGLLFGGISSVLVLLLFTRPRVYHAMLTPMPERARPFAIGAVNALPVTLLLRNPLSALVSGGGRSRRGRRPLAAAVDIETSPRPLRVRRDPCVEQRGQWRHGQLRRRIELEQLRQRFQRRRRKLGRRRRVGQLVNTAGLQTSPAISTVWACQEEGVPCFASHSSSS